MRFVQAVRFSDDREIWINLDIVRVLKGEDGRTRVDFASGGYVTVKGTPADLLERQADLLERQART